jgi:photosystem II stability/assembly factor-like uncharacterized protein
MMAVSTSEAAMKRTIPFMGIMILAVATTILVFTLTRHNDNVITPEKFRTFKMAKRGDTSRKPTDWFTLSRAYPYSDIPFQAYRRALDRAVAIRNATQSTDQGDWEMAGPSNVGGRVTALAAYPGNPNTIYAGAALGGVLKSSDGGETWRFVSDDVPSLSVGALAIDPSDSNRIYFGTGEANSSGDSYAGTGIYRSTDGGESWQFIGLPESRHIGRIAIDPDNPQRIFVAAMGTLFGTNHDRGVYRSTDGGDTWEQVHYMTDSTGCIDVAVNPTDGNIVYAAMWERIRNPVYRRVGGMTSSIWRSTDGGDNWSQLTNGLPPDDPDNGRIGLGISPTDPDIVYAVYYDHPGNLMGIWRTTDGGDSWESRLVSPNPSEFAGFGWYFGNIWVHPTNSNTVYLGDMEHWRSTDGGAHWSSILHQQHVDMHAMWQNPNNPNYIVTGNDGGVFTSINGGTSWTKRYDLHITQFYAITIDQLMPQRLYGGTQDNSTPRTLTGGIDDWDVLFYGDGFYANVDWTNSNIIYAESQYGYLGKSTNLGEDWDFITYGISSSERTNWNTPVIISPHDHNVLFYGAERVYRTTNGGGFWNPISPNLTGGAGGGNLIYGTVTTISQSPLDADVIWAGTDDSRVWVTTNGGGFWTMVSSDLPNRWCTRVTADVFDSATAYVTFSGYQVDELLPHIFKTTNYGASWSDISGNLVDIPVNDILPDPEQPERLFIGTDFGMYYTEDGGTTWQAMGEGHPICPVFDIDLSNSARKLVSGTHGRSMYSFDLSQLGVPITESRTSKPDYRLHQNYPNPFNSTTVIPFDIRQPGHVTLKIYDVNGRLVTTLIDRQMQAGSHSATFNAEGLASGTYFAALSAANSRMVKKIVYLK